MDESHVIDDIPAYVLGALNAERLHQVEVHISGCSECRNEMVSYQIVAGNLSYLMPQRDLPPGLRSSILQKVSQVENEKPMPIKERVRLWFSPLASPAWGGVSLVLIFILAVGNIFLFQQSRLTKESQSDFRIVSLAGQKNALGASGVIVMSGDGNFGTLVVDNLPVLDPTKQYQLWLVKEGKRTSGGVFSVFDTGYGILVVKSQQPLSMYDTFGVTIEPAGGSNGPTGNKVLAGTI
jgi:anti-sigma-K factor RskA